MQRDTRGLALSTDSAEVGQLFSLAVEHYLKAHADTMTLVNAALAADPEFVMGHVLKGSLLVAGANVASRPAIASCLTAAAKVGTATRRERLHIQALEASHNGQLGVAMDIWDAILDEYPADLMTIRISNVAHFRHGHTRAILERSDALARHWSRDVPGYECFLTVWAFAHEEVGDTAAADRAIDSAYDIDPVNFFAHHVKAHILGAEGRQAEGVDWLNAQTIYWPAGANLVHHLWWHQALMMLDLGQRDAVLESYDRNIRNLDSPMTKAAPAQFNDLQNASALLWRLEQQGLDVGARWEELAEKAAAKIDEPAQPLLSPHLMMALASVGREAAAARLLEALRARAAEPGVWDADGTTEAVIPVCEAVLAHRIGLHGRVVGLLEPILHGALRRLGGSAAQRDLFRQILIDSAMKVERRELVARMLAEETEGHPSPVGTRAGYDMAARWSGEGRTAM